MAPRVPTATTAVLLVNSSSTGSTRRRSPPLLARLLRPGAASPGHADDDACQPFIRSFPMHILSCSTRIYLILQQFKKLYLHLRCISYSLNTSG
jgi:hypothetical protein